MNREEAVKRLKSFRAFSIDKVGAHIPLDFIDELINILEVFDWKEASTKGPEDRLVLDKRDAFKDPVKSNEPRCGMGYEYYDWMCPTCGHFLAFEPHKDGIPRRCQNCGQLLNKN